MKKSRVLISSVLTIALCLSLISGATFALFTDKSETNVAVTSGKVNVVATIENVQLDTTLEDNVPETSYEVVNGNELVLTGMVPGDYLTFQLHVQNNSDITVLYRTLLKVASDNGLWQGLAVEINGQSYLGQTKVSNWTSLAPETHPDVVNVKISLPEGAGNAYQGKTCSISYTVEAVQGNAYMTNPDENTTYIYNVTDLLLFADSVKNGTSYAGKTVELMADIDMAGIYWTGIGVNNTSAAQGYLSNIFQGTFKGNGHKVTNMTMSNDYPGFAAAGFFNVLGANATVEGLTIENAVINSTHYAGAIVGWAHAEGTAAQIKNCHVVNASITSNTELVGSNWDNGDKAGGIAGYLCGYTVSDCTVKDSAICAYRDLGGIIGFASNCTIDNCDLLGNVTVTVNKMHNYKNYTEDAAHDANSYVGECNETSVNNCDGTASISAAAMVTNAEELKAALLAGGHVVIMNDIDMTGWTSLAGNNRGFVLDGNNYTLKNLSAPLFNTYPAVNFTVMNVKFDAANINTVDGSYAGVIVGEMYSSAGGNYLIENCHITNSSIKGFKYAGGFIGFTAAPVNGAIGSLTIKNCSVNNSEIATEDSSAGALIGHNWIDTVISDCSVLGTTSISCIKNRNGKEAKAGYLIGTVNANTTTITNCTVASAVTLSNVNAKAPVANGMVGRCFGKIMLNGGEYVADGVTKNEAGEYLISNAEGLQWFNDQVNKQHNSFSGLTVKLTADIDMKNAKWLPAGQNDAAMYGEGYNTVEFKGVFDGCGHIISNIKIDGLSEAAVRALSTDKQQVYSIGFIGYASAATIKNVTFNNATVAGYHYVGTIVGMTETNTVIENCHVINSTISVKCLGAEQCGDKVGGIVGNLWNTIRNCSVKNCQITASRDAGQVVGCAHPGSSVIDCRAENVTVAATGDCTGTNIREEIIGRVNNS